MMPAHDASTLGADIERLIQRVETLDPKARVHAQELVRLLMSFYGAGLSRILDVARTEEGGPQALLDRFAGDPLIASLLVLHDLHPHPAAMRVERALAALQPHLPRGTRVTAVAVGQEEAHIRVDLNGSGGGPSPDGTRMAIERAVREAAPEIGAIHVDGLPVEGADRLIQIVRRPVHD